MSSLSLNVEGIVGCDIQDVCSDAIVLAQQLQIMITFDFTGVYMVAMANSDEEVMVKRYHTELKRGGFKNEGAR